MANGFTLRPTKKEVIPMDGAEILIPLGFFAMIAAIVIVPNWLKSQERQKMQDTLRTALENGQQLSPDVIEAINTNIKGPPSRARDFRTGAVWLALAGALVTIGAINGWHEGFDDDFAHFLFAFAAIPGFVGLVYVVFGFLNKDRK
jgi:hypothetical protein